VVFRQRDVALSGGPPVAGRGEIGTGMRHRCGAGGEARRGLQRFIFTILS
jgi:hypothetical protein